MTNKLKVDIHHRGPHSYTSFLKLEYLCTMGKLANEVKSGELWLIISPRMLIQKVQNFATVIAKCFFVLYFLNLNYASLFARPVPIFLLKKTCLSFYKNEPVWRITLGTLHLFHSPDWNFGISPTAGGGGLGRLRSSPPSPSPSPQVQRGEAELDLGTWTWTWTRGTWAEVARGAHHWLLSSTPSPSSSTPRRSRGVLELGRGVLELKLHEEESKYTEA